MSAAFAVTFGAAVCLVVERTAFGPLAVWREGPDLLMVLLVGVLDPRRPLQVAAGALALGLVRDLASTTRPGLHSLAYLVAGLLFAQLERGLRGIPRAPTAGLLTLAAGAVVAVLGWVFAPDLGLGSALARVLLCATYTMIVAAPLLWLSGGGRR